jgi:hypothetical protein
MGLWSGMMDSFPNSKITDAFFANNTLTVALNDGRIILFPCIGMKWLMTATPEQQRDFNIESDGYGVWWNELDDGIALHHILNPAPIQPSKALV